MSFSLAGYLSSVDVCLFYRISCWPGSLAATNKMENIWVFRHRSRIFVTDMSRNNHGHQITMNKAFVTMDDVLSSCNHVFSNIRGYCMSNTGACRGFLLGVAPRAERAKNFLAPHLFFLAPHLFFRLGVAPRKIGVAL